MGTLDLQALLLIALPPTIAAVGALVLGWLNRRKLEEIHVIVNSRLTELVAANSRADHAEGVVQGTSDSAQLTEMVKAAVADALRVVPVVAEVPVVVTPIVPKEGDTHK